MLTWRVLSRLEKAEERAWFERMYAVYERAFPEASEREERSTWERILAGGGSGYRLEFVLATEDESVVAGVVIEYYDSCRCGIVTFLFVRADCRGRGLGRVALERARERLQALAGRRLAFVFAEVEDPDLAREAAIPSAIDPELRLRMFARLGARGLDVPYLQPALGPDKRPLTHLRLLVLHPLDATVVPREVLRRFLQAFYAGLMPEPDAVVLAGRVVASSPEMIPLEPLFG